jgi:putative ABC transport system permease protein
MFFRLLLESFVRQRRRKLLAGIAILLGTTAVTAMLALATTIGDRIHKELAVYGANIIVTPKAANLAVKVGGVDIQPATGNAYLHEADLEKLKTIFWANNITGVSPELTTEQSIKIGNGPAVPVTILGVWINHPWGTSGTGVLQLHPWWKVQGELPNPAAQMEYTPVLVGARLASTYGLRIGEGVDIQPRDANQQRVAQTVISGILTTGDETENKIVTDLAAAQFLAGTPGAISRVEISARTKPEDAFARRDPATLSPADHDKWYCSPYANSIAYQIREAIPGADAQQVRQVEQSEGAILTRISGLMWLVSAAALLAAGFAVSAAMATAILERRHEIGLMRSLGASKGAIALLFYSETGLLAVIFGTLGYLLGSGLAAWLGGRIFADAAAVPLTAGQVFNPVLLPVVVATALLVAMAGSTTSIRSTLRMDPSAVLRADA